MQRMADGHICNNQQPQQMSNNQSLQNGVLNDSSMLSDTTAGSQTSLFEPKMPRPLTLNVTQELRDWEDDAMKRKLGTVLYPLVKKFLTAKMLQSERNLHRFGGEMNELRTSNERLSARVWELVGELVKAYVEIDLYKKRADTSEAKKHAAPVATTNGPHPHAVSADEILDVLSAAENAPNGNGEDLVLEAINIFQWSQREDNDLGHQMDGLNLHPAAIGKAAVCVDDSVNIPNRDQLNVTAASPDFKQADTPAAAAMAGKNTYYDQDATLGDSRSKSAMGSLERSGTGSITMTTNLREDLEKSAFEGESCFYIDVERSYIVPIELDSSDLQTVMHRACELGSVYFSEEHDDLRLTSDWHSHERDAAPERLMFFKGYESEKVSSGRFAILASRVFPYDLEFYSPQALAHFTWLKNLRLNDSLPKFGDVIDVPALVASIGAKLQQLAEQKRIFENNKDIPADFLASLAFIGIVDPTMASIAVSGDRVVFRQFEFPRGKHSVTVVKALHTNAPCEHPVDANLFSTAVMRLAVDVLTETVYADNALRFDYNQLAERVVRGLRDLFENVVAICGQPSALCIANGGALICDPNCEHPTSYHHYRSEEMGFDVYAWFF